MLLSLDRIVARIVKPCWMRLAQDGDKTCEITSAKMGRRCRRGKTHLYMHPTRQGTREGMPDLIAELHPGRPLGPYTEDMVDQLMDDSVRLNFLIGMSNYALRHFIRGTKRGEVYVYRYARARVCKELTWVDSTHNNNNGWLETWNETNQCTRFCFSHESPVLARMDVGEPTGGPLPARWKRVAVDKSTPPGIARWCQLVRVKTVDARPSVMVEPPVKKPVMVEPPVKKHATVWAHKIPRKLRVIVVDDC